MSKMSDMAATIEELRSAAAAITAIIKMCTAGKGKVKLPGISLEWTS